MGTRLWAAPAVALGLAGLAACACSTCPAPRAQASAPLAAAVGTADAPEDVSIIALIAEPERFRDHWVQLVGYLVAEFEGDAIYLDETAFVHNVVRNALALDFEDASVTTPARGTHGYFIVSGKFAPELHGHPGLFSGALTQLHRISPLPARDLTP